MTLEEMRKIKEERGYSLAQLSEYSGVPLGTLQKIFSGETSHPRYATRQALENVLLYGEQLRGGRDVSPHPVNTNMVKENSSYYTNREKTQGEYTIEDYYTQPDNRRIELIDGVIYDMSAPSFIHQQISGSIFFSIKEFIDAGKGDGIPMFAPVDVRLDKDDKTMVQPDLLILCDKNKICKWGIDGAPDFCMEITSASTSRKDYIKKLQKYTDAGVKEYWIVDPLGKRLITYAWNDDYTPHIYTLAGEVGLALYEEELKINLDNILRIITG